MSIWPGILGGQQTAAPPAGFTQGTSGIYYRVSSMTANASNWFLYPEIWLGGTPAVPQNATESNDIYNLIQGTSTDCYLGWKRNNDSSPWLGVLGTTMPYTKWESTYPRSGQQYTQIRVATGNWRSHSGTVQIRMVFQWPPP